MKVDIFTTRTCPYCHAAKALFQSKGIEYQEIDVTFDQAKRIHLIEETGMRTVPQIFIDDKHIGGFDDLRKHFAESA